VRGDGHVGSVTGFALAVFAFFVTMVGTTLPMPLYPLFEQRYSFGPLLVTVIFAIYAFGVIGGLILFGNLSDRLGRKPPLVLGLLLSAASALLFLLAGSLAPIYVARVVSGLSAGIFTGTATAYVIDLSPAGRRRLATFVAVFANLGGLGTGTLLAGLLGQWAPDALRTPFAVDLGLVVVATVGLLLAPETVTRGTFSFRLQRLGVPAEVMAVFVPASLAGFAAFAVSGVFSSVAPEFSASACIGTARRSQASSSSSSLSSRSPARSSRGSPTRLQPGACCSSPESRCSPSRWRPNFLEPLFASAVVAGVGQGSVVSAGLGTLAETAPAERRGETASSFFVVLYLGLSIPVIAAGIAIHYTSLRSAGIGFCAGAGVLALGVLASLSRPT
jgi:MFS family permease